MEYEELSVFLQKNRIVMILIADSGSTKTDWCVAEKGMTVKRVTTQGINPYHQDEATMGRIVFGELMPQIEGIVPEKVAFYGSGCREEKIPIIREILSDAFECVGKEIEGNGDLLGAARALCGNEAGIACILGTGSNSCLYDGKGIVENISPLGYILGDEGSGAVLGKLLVGDVLKKQLPAELCEKFLKQFNLDRMKIIENVYKKPAPNRFLASLSPFLIQNIEEPAIHRLVLNAFKSFFVRNIENYANFKEVPVSFVGSVGFYYREVLDEAAKALDITIGTVIKSTMEGLLKYHSK